MLYFDSSMVLASELPNKLRTFYALAMDVEIRQGIANESSDVFFRSNLYPNLSTFTQASSHYNGKSLIALYFFRSLFRSSFGHTGMDFQTH